MTPLGQAITDAGWPPEVVAKACSVTTTEVKLFFDTGPNHVSAKVASAINTWVDQRSGRASNGLIYVDPYRPVQTMNMVDHPVVQSSRGHHGT